MKIQIYLILLLCFCGSTSYSQKIEMIDYFSRISCDEYLARMQLAMLSADKNPNGKIYFLMYEGPTLVWAGKFPKTKMANPVVGSFQAKVRSMKRLILLNKRAVSDFVFVNAGFRNEPTVEVWLVPKGAEPPKSTPTVEKMKLRNGKAKGFCTDCCGP